MKRKLTSNLSRFTCLIVVFVLGLFLAPEAKASHFRFTKVTWSLKSGTTAEFVVTSAFRRDGSAGPGPFTGPGGLPGVGDIITENQGATGFNFGDGTFTGTLKFKVIAIDLVENVMIGRALQPGSTTIEFLTHTYATPLNGGLPWVAQLQGCCRLGALQNYSGSYRVQTEVRFDIANNSPVTSLPSIVNVPINTNYSFLVPAADLDGDVLSYRFATSAESGNTNPIGPAGGADAANAATIDPVTGQITWNTTGGTAINDLFTAQVVIEESRNGSVIGRVAIEFLLKIVAQGNAPSCVISPAGPYNVNAGSPMSFILSGTDPDAGDVLTLNTAGLPTSATMSPGLPFNGLSGLSSTFNWTPTIAQAGPNIVVFNVTDQNGLQNICSVSINVSNCPDADNDTVCDDVDNCVNDANPGQEDWDADGLGDICDPCPYDADNDIDGDGICGDVDNCPNIYNPGQEDLDNDGIGDVCDPCHKYVLYAEEELEIENTIVHSGGVGVEENNGEAKIDDDSDVTAIGTWVQAAEVDVKDGSVVSVVIENPADKACLPAFIYSPHDTDEDVCVEEGETLTISGSIYDDIKIEDGGTLIFSGSNEVYVESFDADENALVVFNQCTDLIVEYEFELGKYSDFNPSNESVRVFAESEILFKGRNTVYGLFYSLTEDITIRRGKSYDRNSFHGQFIAEDIWIEKYTDLYYQDYQPCNNPNPAPLNEQDDVEAPQEMITAEEETETEISTPSPFKEMQGAKNNIPYLKVAPNPFQNATNISFNLESEGFVSVEIYNLNGQLINQLFSGTQSSGTHKLNWNGNSRDGSQLENGIYFIILKTADQVITKKVSLMK